MRALGIIARSRRRVVRVILSTASIGVFLVAELTFSQSSESDKRREPLAALLQERLNNHIVEGERMRIDSERFHDLARQQLLTNSARITALESVADNNARWLSVIGISIILMALKEILGFPKSRRSDK